MAPAPSKPSTRAAPAGGVAVDGVLPADLLLEVLLRLSAREVCRLRAVCPSWRSLTYDPTFAAAHAARHPGPLLAMRVRGVGDASSIDLVGLPGDVVRRIPVPECHDYRVLGTRFDCVFLRGANHSISVLDPATGSVRALPAGTAEDLVLTDLHMHTSWTAFGQVSSTGEYKLLRIVQDDVASYGTVPLCEVFTFGKGFEQWRKKQSTPADRDGVGQWGKKESPPFYLDASCPNGAVVNGSVYFLFDLWKFNELLHSPPYDYRIKNIQSDWIPSFNLETEQWSVAVQGPLRHIIQEADDITDGTDLEEHLVLAELKGFLVTVYFDDMNLSLDLWFLMDFENSVWSKEHRIQFEFIAKDLVEEGVQLSADDVWDVRALSVTNEGRIILLVRTPQREILQIYDRRANSATCVLEMHHRRIIAGVGIYTGGLLC